MTNLFIAYVAAFLLPFFFHSWRVAVVFLGLQGVLLGFILFRTHDMSPAILLEAINLFLAHGVFVPWVLFRAMREIAMPTDFALIKKSIYHWLTAFVLVLLAFVFGRKMAPDSPFEAMQVGTAASAILLGVLVLANQSHPLGQIVGLLTFEGGLTLVELLSPHAMPFKAYVGVSFVFVVLVLTCCQYLPLIAEASTPSNDPKDSIVL